MPFSASDRADEHIDFCRQPCERFGLQFHHEEWPSQEWSHVDRHELEVHVGLLVVVRHHERLHAGQVEGQLLLVPCLAYVVVLPPLLYNWADSLEITYQSQLD